MLLGWDQRWDPYCYATNCYTIDGISANRVTLVGNPEGGGTTTTGSEGPDGLEIRIWSKGVSLGGPERFGRVGDLTGVM